MQENEWNTKSRGEERVWNSFFKEFSTKWRLVSACECVGVVARLAALATIKYEERAQGNGWLMYKRVE